MRTQGKIGFNVGWAETVDKQTFIAVHKEAYPGVDLGKEYDKIVPPVKKVKEKVK